MARIILMMAKNRKENGWVNITELFQWVKNYKAATLETPVEITQKLLEKCSLLGAIVYKDDEKKDKFRITGLGEKNLRNEIKAIFQMRYDPYIRV